MAYVDSTHGIGMVLPRAGKLALAFEARIDGTWVPLGPGRFVTADSVAIPMGKIVGRLQVGLRGTDETGQESPIGGWVRLARLGSLHWKVELPIQDGAVQTGDLVIGEYLVLVRSHGRMSARSWVELRTGETTRVQASLHALGGAHGLPQPGFVLLLDDDKAPLRGVSVRVQQGEMTSPQVATTDSLGTLRLRKDSSDMVVLTVDSPHYHPSVDTSRQCFLQGCTMELQTVRAEFLGETNEVYREAEGVLLDAERGAPIVGASVFLAESNGTLRLERVGTSAPSGSFMLRFPLGGAEPLAVLHGQRLMRTRWSGATRDTLRLAGVSSSSN